MIFLFYGLDEYRLTQKLSECISQYSEKYGSSLVLRRINLIDSKEEIFWETLNQSSLFVSKKVFVIENIFLSQIVKKSFLKKIKELATSEHIIFFVEKEEIKTNDPLFLALKENGKIQEFPILSGKKLEMWAMEQFSLLGCVISNRALNILLDRTKNDVWLLSNEIKKLSLFKKEITEQDINNLTRSNIELEIFKTIDSILSSNKKQALMALQNYFDSGESLFYLLSMIAMQARNLLLVKVAQNQGEMALSNLNMHPFVLKKALQITRATTVEKLKDLMKKIFLAELEIKTGLKSPEQSVKFLATSI